jgi:hypothetical protein
VRDREIGRFGRVFKVPLDEVFRYPDLEGEDQA